MLGGNSKHADLQTPTLCWPPRTPAHWFQRNRRHFRKRGGSRRRASQVPLMDRLLERLVEDLTPATKDEIARDALLKRLQGVLDSGGEGLKHLQVQAHGSFWSGLYSPSNDVDVSLEDQLPWSDPRSVKVEQLTDGERVQLLRNFKDQLVIGRVANGVETVFGASIPLLKFTCSQSGLDVDLTVANGTSRFKSSVLGALAGIDPRLGELVRLVKAWAKAQGVNSAYDKTMNSYCLTLLVVYHLQTRHPPILPPICKLLGQSESATASRPLHEARDRRVCWSSQLQPSLEMCKRLAAQQPRSTNTSTTPELLASFFADMAHQLQQAESNGRYSRTCLSCWAGKERTATRAWKAPFGVEDPFDATSNAAYSVWYSSIWRVSRAFKEAAALTSGGHASGEGARAAFMRLFKKTAA